jgi:hypothetical protein
MEACRLSEKRFARWTQDWQDLMILVSLGGNNETVARFRLRVIRRGADGALYELSFRSVRGLRLGRIWRNRFAFVEAGPVVEGGEGAGYHAVNVEGAAEMVDFVLKNAGVPARGLNELGFGACVEILDADGAGAGHDGGKSGEAEAAFVEISLFVAFVGDHWIDDDVKWDRAALAFAEVFGGKGFQQIFAVFDHGELERQADLGCGEAHAGRVTHGVAHFVNEALDFFAEDVFGREKAGLFAEHRFARLHNFQTHPESSR